jgi:hypothetical protein
MVNSASVKPAYNHKSNYTLFLNFILSLYNFEVINFNRSGTLSQILGFIMLRLIFFLIFKFD